MSRRRQRPRILWILVVPAALYVILLVYLAVFGSVPYVTINDKGISPPISSTLNTILQEHVYPAPELCDPLPCWIRFDVEEVTTLEQPRILLNNASGVLRSDIIPVVEASNRPNSDETMTCPAGHMTVSGTIRRQWWSIFATAPNTLEGANLVLCIKS